MPDFLSLVESTLTQSIHYADVARRITTKQLAYWKQRISGILKILKYKERVKKSGQSPYQLSIRILKI
jgi:hypothetical protein